MAIERSKRLLVVGLASDGLLQTTIDSVSLRALTLTLILILTLALTLTLPLLLVLVTGDSRRRCTWGMWPRRSG